MTPPTPGLLRFGNAAVRLARVLAIREEDGAVRVYYEGCDSVVFDGADAEALRSFVAALSDPWSALAQSFAADDGGSPGEANGGEPTG